MIIRQVGHISCFFNFLHPLSYPNPPRWNENRLGSVDTLGRASRVLRLGIKGTRETQRRIREDAGRRNGFHHGQQRNHDFHRVSNSAHGRAHARTFSSLALRRPLNLYRDRDDRNKVRVHPVRGDFRGEIWKCDYVARLNSKFGIGMRIGAGSEVLFIPLWIRLEN